MKNLCKALTNMPRSGIRVVMELAEGMDDVIHMELGEPGFQTPDHIKEAGCKAIHDGFTKYTINKGMTSLREAIVAKLRRDGADVTIDQIGVAPGSVYALSQAMMSVTNPGEEVLLPDPGWPNCYMQVLALERTPVTYPLREENGFEPVVEDLEPLITDKTRAMLINSPSNPTGAVFSEKTVKMLVDFAKRHDIYLISDEVYEQIVFDGKHHSPLWEDPCGNVISIYGVSKSYAMTGWRLGYYCGPKDVAASMNKQLEPFVSCACAISQKAAEAALNGPQDCVYEMVDAYRQRRDLVTDVLAREGFEFSTPKGAFYLMANVGKAGMDSYTFAKELLKATHVATAPGLTFGKGSDQFIRFSFCADTDQIRDGINKFCDFYKSHI